jgi:hypothetical protein
VKIIRRTLANNPPVFFELNPEEQRIVMECCAMTRTNFEIFAFHTDSLFALGNRVIRQFPAPTKPPGQVIGWNAYLFPKKLYLPMDEFGRSKLELENAAIKSFRFSIVVEPKSAALALTAVLRHALFTLRLGELNASSAGLMI